MDYEAITRVAQAACVEAIKLMENTHPATADQQAAVYTSGIIAAIREYDRQKAEESAEKNP